MRQGSKNKNFIMVVARNEDNGLLDAETKSCFKKKEVAFITVQFPSVVRYLGSRTWLEVHGTHSVNISSSINLRDQKQARYKSGLPFED